VKAAGLLSSVAFAVLVLAWAVLLRPGFLAGKANYIVVSGHSMEPTYYTGDLVITHKAGHYQAGDIVAFKVEGGLVIHRIVGGNGDEGFDMQGDNNPNPDRWKPRADQIIGKAWLHVGGFGRWLERLGQPSTLAPLVGGVTAFSLYAAKPKAALRKLQRRMRHPRSDGGGPLGQLPAPPWAIAGLTLSALLLAGLGFYAFKAFTTEASRTVLVSDARYEHDGGFKYSFEVTPSTLYPSGAIASPQELRDESGAFVPQPPVYVRQAKRLTVDFAYMLASELPADVKGTVSADVQIRATGTGAWTYGWKQQDPAPFAGTEAGAHIVLDIAPITAAIKKIEEETGVSLAPYEITIVPTVRVTGTVGKRTIEETYSPAFSMSWTGATILVKPESMIATEPRDLSTPVTQRPTLSLGIASPSIPAARFLGMVGMALAAAAAAGFASVVFLGLGQDEAAQVRARYGARLVPVTEFQNGRAEVVKVASLQDLAVLAQRDGRIIFNQATQSGPLYFVPDGSVIYEYLGPHEVLTSGRGHRRESHASNGETAVPRTTRRNGATVKPEGPETEP
jgi:signal peptidase